GARVWTILAGCLLLACRSNGSSEAEPVGSGPTSSGETAEVSCAADSRVSPFQPGLSATGPHGFTVTIEQSTPMPPAIGDNLWDIVVTGDDGASLAGATLRVVARMPDHGHNSPKTPTASTTDEAGKASISNLDLFMAGVWQIELEITAAGATSPSDTAVFTFCVEG
ncbi:MAG TPA: prealbumin-like fold domain-containing protein, partial [Polyangiaceae bacterium]|nr:prealbumin-like fold domain-containing protein [Polyangiaceae bacterium]